MVSLLNSRTGGTIARNAVVRNSLLGRLVGFLFRSRPRPGEAMLLMRTARIHTAMMRFDLDLYYLDTSLRVIGISRNIRPWRFPSAPRGCRHVLEAPSSPDETVLPLCIGDRISILWENGA